MAKNGNLHSAKREKQDEFYTQLSTIQSELKWYVKHFENKVVFLNCDDPEYSNFYIHFKNSFETYKLKKLIVTHYELSGKQSYKLEVTRDENNELVYTKTPLEGNGDFRSEECIELLKEADIVVTNPPFSLFKEYISQLMEYDKKFLIIGNMNAIKYKMIFPYIVKNKLWLGTYCGEFAFKTPDYYEPRETRFWVDENNQKWRSFGNICWFTNMDHYKRKNDIKLSMSYYGSEDKYPKYENYEAINVDKVCEIPRDFEGVMGVPITFLDKFNPSQFEIVGSTASWDNNDEIEKIRVKGKSRGGGLINGKSKFARILVRNKKVEKI